MFADRPRLHVDLGALAHNWQAVRSACAGTQVGAVVKNDAYGLGVAAVVPLLWGQGCRDFWVASADEGLAVRQSLPLGAMGQGARIWVLNGLAGCAPADFAQQGITPVLTGAHELQALHGYAARHAGARMPVALHLDTGLTRLGFDEAALAPLLPGSALWADAAAQMWVTHLGRFHDPEAPQCQRQRERFEAWTARLPAAARSIATSSSIFAGAHWHYEHARVGSALWGVPIGGPVQPGLRPVASLQAPVLRVAEVPAGIEVGYLGRYTTPGPRRIATVAMGYGDGLPFGLVNQGQLMLAGRAAPIVGGVAMGMVGVDVSDFAHGAIRPGMLAEVFGAQQPLQALARDAGVPANVLLVLAARGAQRHYVAAGARLEEVAA
jgi:alanine racemase